jgi:hypothetical protein
MASRALALVRVPRLRRVSSTFRAERAAIRGFFRRFLAGFGPCEGCFGRDFACGVLGLRCRSERGISNWANAAGSGVSPGAGTDGDGSRGVGLPSRSGRFPCGFGSRSRLCHFARVRPCFGHFRLSGRTAQARSILDLGGDSCLGYFQLRICICGEMSGILL